MNKVIKQAPKVANILKLLSHEGRLKIICFLSEGEKNASELEALTKLSQSHISQYLTKFEMLKVISSRKDGKWTYYNIKDPDILKLMESLHSIFCKKETK